MYLCAGFCLLMAWGAVRWLVGNPRQGVCTLHARLRACSLFPLP